MTDVSGEKDEVTLLSQPLDADGEDDEGIGGESQPSSKLHQRISEAQAGAGNAASAAYAGLKTQMSKVLESKPVQTGVGYGKTIIESEKVQQSVKVVKEKASAVAQHEKVQLGTEFVKEKATLVKEKAADSLGFVKDTGKAAWDGGKFTLDRVKHGIREGEWKGSASNTLGIAEKEGMWKDIKVKGAEEMQIAARKEHTTSYHVEKGYILRWTFRVKDHDLGFGVRMRVMQDGGSVEQEVLPVEKFDDQETVSGSTFAEETRTLVLVFDNTYSKLRSKTVAYFVGVECAKRPDPEPEPIAIAEDPAPAAQAESTNTGADAPVTKRLSTMV